MVQVVRGGKRMLVSGGELVTFRSPRSCSALAARSRDEHVAMSRVMASGQAGDGGSDCKQGSMVAGVESAKRGSQQSFTNASHRPRVTLGHTRPFHDLQIHTQWCRRTSMHNRTLRPNSAPQRSRSTRLGRMRRMRSKRIMTYKPQTRR